MKGSDEVAERRMFTKKITESDAFLDMPMSTQCLYFHLNMSADDDGFVNNPRKIQRMIGGSDDDLKLLVAKRFVIAFDDGIIVIKHWRMNNYLRSDRYKPTVYQEELAMLNLKDNGSYSLKNDVGIPNGYHCETQYSIGKDSIGKGNRLSLDNLCQTETVRRVLEDWNTLSEYGIKTVSRLTNGTKRYDSLVARLKQYGIDDVLKAIDNVRHSDFLQGKHGGKPWQITFDWFVLPNNFPKVLDGNYNYSVNDKEEKNVEEINDSKWQ